MLKNVKGWLNDQLANSSDDEERNLIEGLLSAGWQKCEGRETLPCEKINPYTKDFYAYPVLYVCEDVVDIRYFKFGNGSWWYWGQCMDAYVKAWYNIPSPDETLLSEVIGAEEKRRFFKAVNSAEAFVALVLAKDVSDAKRLMKDYSADANMSDAWEFYPVKENAVAEIKADCDYLIQDPVYEDNSVIMLDGFLYQGTLPHYKNG